MEVQQAYSERNGLRFSPLSAKVAVGAALATVLVTFGIQLLAGSLPLYVFVLSALFVGSITYVLVYKLLMGRLELARTTLKQFRKHHFENLEAVNLPRGDELNALIRQVYRAGLAMEKELQSLHQMENYRREYLGDVSHELKTPIFTIQGFAETLINGAIEDDKVNRKFLQKILTNTKRLTNLASDLVEISRLETGELEMKMASFHLKDVMNEVVEQLEHVALEKNVDLRVDLQDNLPKIIGDRTRISQVMVNLVDNAIKYSNDEGDVEVVARQEDADTIRVTVIDKGIGIAPQHIPRLTERFYRVDKSRSRLQGGTGLGLAIVKHILGAHDAEMKVESSPGKGSRFEFTLRAVAA